MPKPKPLEPVVKRTYHIFAGQDKALKHLAVDLGKSVTELVREALEEYLERRSHRDS